MAREFTAEPQRAQSLLAVREPKNLKVLCVSAVSSPWLRLRRAVEGEKKYGTYGVFDLPEGITVRHHSREWIDRLTSGYERLALDDIPVRTMNGYAATAFQWFGLRAKA